MGQPEQGMTGSAGQTWKNIAAQGLGIPGLEDRLPQDTEASGAAIEDRMADRRARYLERAAECEGNAAANDVPASRDLWLAAASTWRKLAASCKLVTQIEQTENISQSGALEPHKTGRSRT